MGEDGWNLVGGLASTEGISFQQKKKGDNLRPPYPQHLLKITQEGWGTFQNKVEGGLGGVCRGK